MIEVIKNTLYGFPNSDLKKLVNLVAGQLEPTGEGADLAEIERLLKKEQLNHQKLLQALFLEENEPRKQINGVEHMLILTTVHGKYVAAYYPLDAKLLVHHASGLTVKEALSNLKNETSN